MAIKAKHGKRPVAAAMVLALAFVLSACTGASDNGADDHEPTSTASATVAPATVAATAPATAPPTPAPLHPSTALDPRAVAYEAEVAAWPDPLPPGYSWPAYSDLPTGLAGTQVGDAQNAKGVYRCILIDAAWHAYFEDNDPVSSKDFARRADTFRIPDNRSTIPVTKDGVIVDSELATANGICRGIAGELTH